MAAKKTSKPPKTTETAPGVEPTPRPSNDPVIAAYDEAMKEVVKEVTKEVPTKPKAEAVEKAFDLGEIERVLATGDLKKLTPDQRAYHLMQVCKSLGLNPLTRPFEYLNLDGKLVLYARRDCTDQLRKIHGVSVIEVKEEFIDGIGAKGDYGVMRVTVRVKDKHNREDMDFGVVVCNKKMGALEFANAMKKAMTQAKRRATLSLCGLGMLDETETPDLSDQPVSKATAEPAEVAEVVPPSKPAPALPAGPDVKAELAAATEHMKAILSGVKMPEPPVRHDIPPMLADDAPPTEAAFKLYEALCGQMEAKFKVTRDKIKAQLKKEYGVESSRELTADQLSQVINRFQVKLADG